MKYLYTLLLATLLLIAISDISAQTTPCTLTGGVVTVTYSAPPIMMHAAINGISQYTFGWNDGTPVGSSSQKPFYSGWCVTITDIMTGCDTTICESCIPTGGIGACPMIYMPVCGCDGNIYNNDCIAMQNGIFTFSSAIGANGQLLPCPNSTTCTVDINSNVPLDFCEGDTIQLEAQPWDTNATYLWSTGETTSEIWVNSSGIYSVTFTNDTGCVATDSVGITVYPTPVLNAYTVPNPASICLGDSLVIEVTQGFDNYWWNTGNPSDQDQDRVVVFPAQDFTYVVETLDSNGCDARVEIFVDVDTCATGVILYLANQISIYPNPSQGNMTIDLPFNETFEFELIDITGKVISQEKEIKETYVINNNKIAKGTYIIKLKHATGIISKKVVFK